MPEPPIACSLSGDDQAKRAEEIAELCRRALLDTEQTQSGLKLRFAAQPGIHAALQRLVELESRCCPFLRFDLIPAEGDLLLEVSGPQDAHPLVRAMFGLDTAPEGAE